MGHEIVESFKFSGNGMDSREIANLTGKEHGHVCRDIQKLLEELGIDQSKFGSVYRAGNGENRRCYILPRRECMLLATGYSIPLRAKLYDRWEELEAAAALMIPKSYAEALRLAADQAEELARKDAEIEAARPAVAFVERFVEAKQTQPLRMVANTLKIPQNKFIDALLERGILYREMRGGKAKGPLMPNAEHIRAGRFEIKQVIYGDDKATGQMRFTALGINWISEKVIEWGMAA